MPPPLFAVSPHPPTSCLTACRPCSSFSCFSAWLCEASTYLGPSMSSRVMSSGSTETAPLLRAAMIRAA
eukprot:104839-Chlamydomonas_euryale.AAC.2